VFGCFNQQLRLQLLDQHVLRTLVYQPRGALFKFLEQLRWVIFLLLLLIFGKVNVVCDFTPARPSVRRAASGSQR
jgi:hypothetical protein